MKAFSGMLVVASGLLVMAGAPQAQEEDDLIYPQDESVPSERCVSANRIRHTEIIDDRNILFHMRGGEIFRNVLPRKCIGLRPNEPISYERRSSQLCDIDRITVLFDGATGLESGASCSLGKFYPVTEPEAEAIRKEAEMVEELGLEN